MKKYDTPVIDLDRFEDKKVSADLDLFDYFPSDKDPYPEQGRALVFTQDFFHDPNKRVAILNKPTASGKSPTAAAICDGWIADGGTAFLMAPTKQLQDQLKKDFTRADGSIGLSVVKGAGEFQCVTVKGSCGSPSAIQKCKNRKFTEENVNSGCSSCPYRQHVVDAYKDFRSKPICVTPHSFLALKSNKLIEKMMPDGKAILVVDEGHLLATQLRGFLTLSLNVSLIEALIGEEDNEKYSFEKEFIGKTSSFENDYGKQSIKISDYQLEYLDAIVYELEERSKTMEGFFKDGNRMGLFDNFPELEYLNTDEQFNYIKLQKENATKLGKILGYLQKSAGQKNNKTDWIAEFIPERVNDKLGVRMEVILRIKPTVVPNEYLREFFSGFTKIIMMSGTFFRNHIETLGMKSSDPDDPWKLLSRFEAGSRIPAHRRRINVDVFNGREVNNRNYQECFNHFADVILNKACKVLPGEKGIIHVSSTAQMKYFTEMANRKARELAKKLDEPIRAKFIETSDYGWNKVYDQFLNTPVGGTEGECTFIVVARRYEGIDLKYDLARMCFMLKVPYPNMKDIMVQALDYKFPGNTETDVLTSFIQGMNRAVRDPTDWALNICFDTNIIKLIKKYGDDLPVYVQEQIGEFTENPRWLDEWEPPRR